MARGGSRRLRFVCKDPGKPAEIKIITASNINEEVDKFRGLVSADWQHGSGYFEMVRSVAYDIVYMVNEEGLVFSMTPNTGLEEDYRGPILALKTKGSNIVSMPIEEAQQLCNAWNAKVAKRSKEKAARGGNPER